MKFKNYYYLNSKEHFSQFDNDLNIVTNKKLYFGKNTDSDPYFIEKKGDNNDDHHLRITINDNSNESLQIWGNSCATTTGCGGEGTLQHKFDSSGNVEHKGIIQAKEFKTLNGTALIPKGLISLWSGTNIPYGWALCDGNNGTPNLKGRFIIGKGDSPYNTIGNKGGSERITLTNDQIPSHNHSGNTNTTGNHNHWMDRMPTDDRNLTGTGGTWQEYGLVADASNYNTNANSGNPGKHTTSNGNHSHNFTTSNTGGGNSHDNMPPYYVLAYIMKIDDPE